MSIGNDGPTGRGDAKRRAVVQAATRAFTTQGYEATSMDAIAAEAGVSKRTVYNHFPGKRDLFRAVVASLYEGLNVADPGRLPPDQPPDAVLPAFTRELLTHMRRPEVKGLLRLVIAEHQRFPDLAEDYLKEGKSRAVALLETYIASQHAHGRLNAPDPATVASQYLGGIKEVMFWPTMLGLPVHADDDRVIADAVGQLMRAYGR